MTKQELYEKAKTAYYNGEPIMSDLEFDTLEKELGLENKSHIGTRHNPSYTIEHPFVMGSLSKVQIHEKDGKIDWSKYFAEAQKYFGNNKVIITPKYDGCSFEVHVNNDHIEISSRGDGHYGRDLYNHLINKIPHELLELGGEYTLRGEVLIKISKFIEKYADQFTNPRSFVAGVLANDFSDDGFFTDKLNDLDIIIYDYRRNDNGWIDIDWTKIEPSNLKVFPDRLWISELNVDKFRWYYDDMEMWRENCEYALDGIVIKPVDSVRINNISDERPKDCVAIKFVPMLRETEVVDITWNLGKTGEYIPIVWVNPVEMDGRMVQKCSGHNYGYLLEKNVGIGAKIIMSLAGDIIPFLYKVTETAGLTPNIPLPSNCTIDGIHLMAILTEKEIAKNSFVNSAMALNIPNIGPATAEAIFDSIANNDSTTDEFFGETTPVELPNNILIITPEQVYFGAGGGKAGNNAMKAFKSVIENLTLNDIIKSFNFKFCGNKVTAQVVNYLLGLDYDFASMASEGYGWCKDNNSNEMKKIVDVLNHLGKSIDDFKSYAIAESAKTANQIPVILTGEPNDYKSKGEFLSCHPEYRVTGSWKEVQIVFTNSLDSNTGKMKKAREKGIEIRIY